MENTSIKELVELLTDGYDLENIEAITAHCEDAYNIPREYAENNDLGWLIEEEDTDSLLNVAIPYELSEISITGDKIDEIHEQIMEYREELPPFPYEMEFHTKGYFEWLDGFLSQTNDEILEIGDSLGDNLTLFLVYRKHTETILAIAQKFELKCSNPKDALY